MVCSMPANAAAPARAGSPTAGPAYVEDVVRAFVIATTFWGVAAFAAGVFIALELAFPLLNMHFEWSTFGRLRPLHTRSEEHTSELQSLMRISYAVFCLKKKTINTRKYHRRKTTQ